MKARIPAMFRSRAAWLLVAVFAFEFFLFDQFGARRHTPVYPRWNDQIQYLTESYTGYELARERGLVAGLSQALTNSSAQGTLHDFLAIIAFLIAGPSRSAALALNMLALIAWQAALFAAVAQRHGSRALGFAAALLPLALTGPWQNIPGSAFDFRLDHFALCALGITAALALLTDGLRNRRASTWFGVAVGVTLLFRFLTGTYFLVLFAGLFVWIWRGADRGVRIRNLVHVAVVAAVIAIPFFWLNFDMVRDYYWIGHYFGPESAIRNPHLGLGSSTAFVGRELAQRHLGVFFAAVALIGAAGLAFMRGGERRSAVSDTAVVGGLFLFAPALVLILHQQKSEVVVNALVPGIVMLVIALWLWVAQRARPAALTGFAALITVIVLLYFTRTQVPPAYTPAQLADIRQVNTIADRVFARARKGGMKELRVAVDYITDCLDAQVLRVICYERHRVLVSADMTLPTSIAEPAEAVVMTRLAASDFVFLTEEAPAGLYPYDRKLEAMRPQVRAWCEANLRAPERFTLFGRRMVLYQRREIPIP